ncbi:divergent PAP2 family protein [Candidatus Aerophobetes bacterium]|uniref:Divergent PAP2 family protein n=1 Tax=Aerophobetes bacterium TaxID=2030807 RepID=A0A662DLD0_UNCAE|nr:MAG: divergent PAP2 family protein [Candidatus Aerophobetes bacterium]
MKYSINLLLNSKLLWSVASAWVLAQGLKVITSFLKEKKLKLHRFIEPGGMPSSHAAMVIALLTGVGIKEGVPSTLFIVTLIFSMAIIYEAIGVRRAVGEQAEVLNQIINKLPGAKKIKLQNKEGRKYLKEILGHSPLEVLVGSIIGLVMALIWLR